MQYFFKIILSFVFLSLITRNVVSQVLPPIEKFTPEDYGGENQNWMISQASNGYIYAANSGGLLEFNGAKWQLFPSPNDTDIRAVNVINDRIYIGCFKEFGYWEKDTIGKLKYHSLVKKLKENSADKSIDNENIWNILAYEEWVLFQTQERIYFYNTLSNSFKIIFSDNIITKVFRIKKTIYYHVAKEGIYKIEQGKPKLIAADEVLKGDRVVNIFAVSNQLLIQTHKSGFFLLEDTKLSKWKTPANDFIKSMSVFNSIQLEDGSFILGTISNGIVHLDPKGNIKYQINQKNGLSNNTALSLFEDKDKNVWVGLDNGINCINIKSPIKVFNDYDGVLGTIYVSTIFNNYLYLGTNQGLFFKKLNSNENNFQFIRGTAGQVWNLYIHNNDELFCAHHNGTFIINKGQATLIDNTPGTWSIKPIPKKKNTLLQGNYSGLYVLKKEKDSWVLKNKIQGFDNSARYFEINNQNQVWISHGYKGVFRLKLDKDLTNATSISLEPELSIGKKSSLVKYKNNILYAYEGGVFKYDSINESFKYDSIISPLIENDNYMSGKLVASKNGVLWTFSKNNINYLTTDNLTNKLTVNMLSIPSHLRKGMVGYEDISLIKNEEYLFGTANGYITIDLSKINYTQYNVILNSVSLKSIENDKIYFNLNDTGVFDYKPRSINFNYSVPVYDKYLIVKYRYKLEGLFNQWSDWTDNAEVSFENLSFGDYNLEVMAKIGNKLSKNIVTYNFKVHKPWYLSYTALIAYFLFFSFLILLIHRAYRKYYDKQHQLKQSANEELIVRIKNEKLKQDIESKNRELAISTMSIIKKNEVLNSIKKELKNNNEHESKDNFEIIKLIDNNINNTKDWKFFEKAFNNVDKDFLNKIRKIYPNLTPNDLRFCVYLRLNLSSKEIAPLLNMSVKSVETKRYRLRKKMNLTHDRSLVNHILEI